MIAFPAGPRVGWSGGPRVVSRGLVVQGRMRAFRVVLGRPSGDHHTSLGKIAEHGLVE